jgi:hypothetical protein
MLKLRKCKIKVNYEDVEGYFHKWVVIDEVPCVIVELRNGSVIIERAISLRFCEPYNENALSDWEILFSGLEDIKMSIQQK